MNAPASPPAPSGPFSNLSREHGFESAQVEGTLPESLRGTLYRNGPGIFEQFGRRYDHLFEGDGAITAVRFSDDRASVPNGVRSCIKYFFEQRLPKMADKSLAEKYLIQDLTPFGTSPWQGVVAVRSAFMVKIP